MAIDDVTPAYVDLLSHGKYVLRTADAMEFNAVKTLQLEYLNTNTEFVPDKKFNRGLGLLICHYYAMDTLKSPEEGGSTEDGLSGVVTTEKVGEITRVSTLPYLGRMDATKMYLLNTVYGIEFLYLMSTFKSSIITT